MKRTPGSILILSGARGDTRRYRTLHLHQQLLMAGVPAVLSHQNHPGLVKQAQEADIIILHRVRHDPLVGRLVKEVQSRSGIVLADIDDLVFEPDAFRWIDSPDFKDPVRARLYQEDIRRNRQTIEACDGVIASTQFLAERARRLEKPVWIHRNAANLELVMASDMARLKRRPSDGKVVIGYASGTPTHNRDFAMITPAVQTVLDAYPQAELRIIGSLDLGEPWQAYQHRLRTYPPVPWRRLPFWLAELDINLAPLVLDNPFSQSKSEIKYLEAALVDVPTIASATDAFVYGIRPGDNGLLAADRQEWESGLSSLVLDKTARRRMAGAALADANLRYSSQVRAIEAANLMNQICADLKRPFRWDAKLQPGNPEAFFWDAKVEPYPSNLDMGLYTLRARGAGTLARQVWIYFRRWLAKFVPYKGN